MSVSQMTIFPEIAFPWEVDTIQFASTDQSEAYFRIVLNDEVLFEELLYFGSDGRVELTDIAQIIQDADVETVSTLSISVSEDGMSWSGGPSVRIIPCTVVTPSIALDMKDHSFLTLLNGPKQVPEDAVERVSFYSETGDETLVVTLYYVTQEGELYRESATFTRGEAGCVSSFVLPFQSFRSFAHNASDRLLRLLVEAGERRQEYLVCPGLKRYLYFLNAFAQQDVLYFSEVSREVKPTRSSGLVGGKHRTFYIEPQTKLQGFTAPLLDSELDWAEDAVHSIYFEDEQGHTVAVIDNDFKYTTSPSELPRLSLTWRSTKPNSYSTRRVRVFDRTFDKTYE